MKVWGHSEAEGLSTDMDRLVIGLLGAPVEVGVATAVPAGVVGFAPPLPAVIKT